MIDRVRAGEHCTDLDVALDVRTTLLFVTYYRPWNEILPAQAAAHAPPGERSERARDPLAVGA
ncbi:MAG: hypothetical protein ABIO70_25540 [Pseudomonadota bacterium]